MSESCTDRLISALLRGSLDRSTPWRFGRPRRAGVVHRAGVLFHFLPGRKWTGPCLLPLCQCSAHIWRRAQPAPPGGNTESDGQDIKMVMSVIKDIYFSHPMERSWDVKGSEQRVFTDVGILPWKGTFDLPPMLPTQHNKLMRWSWTDPSLEEWFHPRDKTSLLKEPSRIPPVRKEINILEKFTV